MDKEPVWVGDKVVGSITNRTFTKVVDSSKHMLRKPPAWAVSTDVIEMLKSRRIEWLVIYDKSTGIRWIVSMSMFLARAFTVTRGKYEPQLALALNHWNHD